MEFIFNNRSQKIANLVNNQLHTLSGQHIGNYLKKNNMFIDISGSYLGEIIQNNKLMYNVNYESIGMIEDYQYIG